MIIYFNMTQTSDSVNYGPDADNRALHYFAREYKVPSQVEYFEDEIDPDNCKGGLLTEHFSRLRKEEAGE